MKREDIPMAAELLEQIKELSVAKQKLDAGLFRAAVLVVEDIAHGQLGVDGKPQRSQSQIELSREVAERFVESLLSDAQRHLRELGVE